MTAPSKPNDKVNGHLSGCRACIADGASKTDGKSRNAMNGTSCIITCSKCAQKLSVPSDRGALHVTCPRCGEGWDWSPVPARKEPELATETRRPSVARAKNHDAELGIFNPWRVMAAVTLGVVLLLVVRRHSVQADRFEVPAVMPPPVHPQDSPQVSSPNPAPCRPSASRSRRC